MYPGSDRLVEAMIARGQYDPNQEQKRQRQHSPDLTRVVAQMNGKGGPQPPVPGDKLRQAMAQLPQPEGKGGVNVRTISFDSPPSKQKISNRKALAQALSAAGARNASRPIRHPMEALPAFGQQVSAAIQGWRANNEEKQRQEHFQNAAMAMDAPGGISPEAWQAYIQADPEAAYGAGVQAQQDVYAAQQEAAALAEKRAYDEQNWRNQQDYLQSLEGPKTIEGADGYKYLMGQTNPDGSPVRALPGVEKPAEAPNLLEVYTESGGRQKGYFDAENNFVPVGGAAAPTTSAAPTLTEIHTESGGKQKGYMNPDGSFTPVGAATTPESKAPTVKTVKLADGSEMAVEWDPNAPDANGQVGAWVPLNAPQGGRGLTPNNKLTENQSKLVLFKRLQTETQPILAQLESQWNPANLQDAAARQLPIGEAFFQTSEGQIYQSAAAAWAEGALRIATGAAATQPEIERTVRTYFAQPGDRPETITFKAQMRGMYDRAIQAALGDPNVEGSLQLPSDFFDAATADNGAGQPGQPIDPSQPRAGTQPSTQAAPPKPEGFPESDEVWQALPEKDRRLWMPN